MPTETVCLLHYRNGVVLHRYTSINDPIVRGTVIREALAAIFSSVLPTDRFVALGVADFGAVYPLFLPAATYEGSLSTQWITRVKIDATAYKLRGTPGFVLPLGVATFRQMTFKEVCVDPNEDGGLIGYDERVGHGEVTFENCTLDGSNGCDWLFYTWVSGTKIIRFTKCRLLFSRIAIAGCSGGGYNQDITADRCTFIGNANGSRSYGESSSDDPNTGGVLAAAVIRGGKLAMWDCNVTLTGLTAEYDLRQNPQWGCPRQAMVTDSYSTNPLTNIILDLQRNKVTHVAGVSQQV